MMTLHMLVEFLERTIFGNKLITDNRTIDNDSVFTFDIPSSSFSSSSSLSDIRMFLFDTGGDGDVGEQPEIITTITCGVLLPYFGFYYQLIVILMIQNIFNYILGSFVYKIVIEPRQERQRQQQQQQKAREKISHKNDNDDDVDNDDNDNGDRDRDDDGDTDNTISTTTMTTPSLLLSSTLISAPFAIASCIFRSLVCSHVSPPTISKSRTGGSIPNTFIIRSCFLRSTFKIGKHATRHANTFR
mmetsp:Transcript_45057/g.51972  ORF Transcript_45057/g.51972 Transcript_45057/m.51972 type:complete len:244 (-) Transcript_45057:19-750(-)